MELILIVLLIAVFATAIVTGINIGLLALSASLFAGIYLLDMSGNEVLAGFPSAIFVLLFGLLMLLVISIKNGTVDWLVAMLLRSARGRIVFLPWVLCIAGFVTASLGPAALPILFVIGAGLSRDFDIPPLLLGAMALHGVQAGSFSPIAPYGLLFSTLGPQHLGEHSPLAVYGIVAGLHLFVAIGAFIAFKGPRLASRRLNAEELDALIENTPKINLPIALTLFGFLMLVFGAIFTDLGVGVIAIFITFVLMFTMSKDERGSTFAMVPWDVMMVIVGVLIYVSVLQEAGAITWLGDYAAALGGALVVVLALCFLSASLTAVASTFGTFGVLIPLSAPFVESGDISATTLLAAIAVSAAVTDICPFSPAGALFVGTQEPEIQKDVQRQALAYTLALIAIVPVTVWLIIFIIPSVLGL